MDGLLDICREQNVDVSYQELDPQHGLLGMYVREGTRQGIILDRSLLRQPRLERCVMAEEVGHHVTAGSGNVCIVHFNYGVAIEMTRTEERGLRWGAEYLMPTVAFANAILSGRRSVDELADYFDVTPWMVLRRFHFWRRDLRNKYCLRVKGRKDLLSPILVNCLWGEAV